MSDKTNSKTQVYPTAQVSPDAFGLGRTSGQRGAEILAGLRAELLPTPESLALARFGGRVIARLVLSIEKSPAALNFVAVRMGAFSELVRQALPGQQPSGRVVEIAAGFSPRGIQMAQSLPNVEVIEVDLPDVVRDKEARLRRGKSLNVPRNLKWRAVDLGVMPLAAVIEPESADVVASEGLNAYLTPEGITKAAASARECLKPGGSYVCDIPWAVGMKESMQATRFFSRQAGTYKGVVENEEEARNLLLAAGYKSVDIFKASVLAAELHLLTPVVDFAFFAVAKN